MISQLRGILLAKNPPELIVDVQGVGYEVSAPMTTFFELPEAGSEVRLYTHLIVREDAHQLYGFTNKRDREVFRTLIKVNGVGPKMTLAILSNIQVNDLVRYVRADDVTALVKLPGIGKKTAERLLIELRDRFKGWELPSSYDFQFEESESTIALEEGYVHEAESALESLGYKQQEAVRLVRSVLKQHKVDSSEELIRLSLKASAN